MQDENIVRMIKARGASLKATEQPVETGSIAASRVGASTLPDRFQSFMQVMDGPEPARPAIELASKDLATIIGQRPSEIYMTGPGASGTQDLKSYRFSYSSPTTTGACAALSAPTAASRLSSSGAP